MEQPPKKTQKVERLPEMPKIGQILREKILENIENKTDGLDIERVCEFMWSKNLPVSDFVFFDVEDIPKLQEILGEKIDVRSLVSDAGGAYLPTLDLILIARDREKEKINGLVYSEKVLIHEQTHAANSYDKYTKTEEGVYRPRSGFIIMRGEKLLRGCFLEEALAEMQSGDYFEQNISPKIKKNIQQLYRDRKFVSLRAAFELLGCEVSEKYFDVIDNGESFGWSPAAIAATGLEMLCRKQPKLKEIIIEARSDIEKLREIPKLINDIKPGLYTEIQKCEYTAEDFIRVQNIIKEAIEDSK